MLIVDLFFTVYELVLTQSSTVQALSVQSRIVSILRFSLMIRSSFWLEFYSFFLE